MKYKRFSKTALKRELAKRKRRRARRAVRAPKKAKPPSLKSLRRKLDAVFSEAIRLRGVTSVERGTGPCVTCGREVHWKDGNAGHFIKRQFLATRYDERNCHLQCVVCNLYRGGEVIEYYRFMQRTYGQGVIDDLVRLKKTTVKLTRADYIALIERFS